MLHFPCVTVLEEGARAAVFPNGRQGHHFVSVRTQKTMYYIYM